MTIAAIIVAAGRGTRAQTDLPKQWQDLCGKPVVAHAIQAFKDAGIENMLLVHHPDDLPLAKVLGVPLAEGGATRDASVRAGLEALEGQGITQVLIHDGARPLVSPDLIQRVIHALETSKAAAPALPITDALWHGDKAGVKGTQNREGLFAAQTPQGFHYDIILAAHRAHSGMAADDVEVARQAGHAVAIVEGDTDNIKITRPDDFSRAAKLMRGAMDIRTGTGFDVHAFGPGDQVTLCGVFIPHDKGLVGHSDADVGLHALTDAIYGALAEGDIGTHFPPSDPQWKGADSGQFLSHATQRASTRGYQLSNCDVTLICETPKIGPHALEMRTAIADILKINIDQISVKATTTEQLGFAGRKEGIAAMASVTLIRQ